jgi:hypothetical protein
MIQVILAVIFTFFLPGFLLINALYPRKGELDPEYDMLYRISLGIVMSVALTIFSGFVLNSLGIDESTGMGFFTAPLIWTSLILLTVLFFILGWFRGAYPFMGKLNSKLYRLPPRDEGSTLIYRKDDIDKVIKLKGFATRREKLVKDLVFYEKKLKLYTGDERNLVDRKKRKIQRELSSLDKSMEELEIEIAGEMF